MRVLGCAFSVLVLMGVAAVPASAAFPGRDGLLAVQPVSGNGLVLVNARGGQERRICTDTARCGQPRNPRWSPDGRALAYDASNVHVIYPDGSCLNCTIRGGGTPAFTADPSLMTFVSSGQLVEDGIDGIYKELIANGSFSDAVWSARGTLAAVRAGALWVGSPRRLRSLGAGSSPSWSPDGSRLAIERKGWVVVIGVSGHSVTRLARGGTPAWSPDGKSIAFVGAHHELRVIPAAGGRSRRVGHVRGDAVDWQPLPATPRTGCVAPPGSTVLASDAAAVVTSDSNPWSSVSMGCLRADGRERFLERLDSSEGLYLTGVSGAAVSDGYAALVNSSEDLHYGGSSDTVEVFDLRTGTQVPGAGGESAACSGDGGCEDSIGQVVVGTGGVTAAREVSALPPGAQSSPLLSISCPSVTLCVAVAAGGAVFTSTDPTSGAWTRAAVPGMVAVSCPTVTLCVGVTTSIFAIGASAATVYTSTDPTGGASTWVPQYSETGPQDFVDISCASVSLCVAVDGAGDVVASSSPTGGAGAWSLAKVDPQDPLAGISCPSEMLCIATNVYGSALASTDPTGAASAWHMYRATAPQAPMYISCPSTTLCVGVSQDGIFTSTDPAVGAPWTLSSAAPALNRVYCQSTAFCLAVGAQGALAVSTSPGSGQWSGMAIDNGQSLRSVFCPTASLCVAGDAAGNLLASPNPTGGAAAWTATLVAGNPCSAETWCTTEKILAADHTGVHTLDTVTSNAPGPLLSDLSLSGTSLTWTHTGAPESAQLQP